MKRKNQPCQQVGQRVPRGGKNYPCFVGLYFKDESLCEAEIRSFGTPFCESSLRIFAEQQRWVLFLTVHVRWTLETCPLKDCWRQLDCGNEPFVPMQPKGGMVFENAIIRAVLAHPHDVLPPAFGLWRQKGECACIHTRSTRAP